MKITPELAKQLGITVPKKNKYGARKTEYNGVLYDSKGEAEHAEKLDERRWLGEIDWWHPKPGSFRLGCKENIFRPDFLVVGEANIWVEEFKGRETAKWRKDKRLWQAYGPCKMMVYRAGKNVEIITPDKSRERQ